VTGRRVYKRSFAYCKHQYGDRLIEVAESWVEKSGMVIILIVMIRDTYHIITDKKLGLNAKHSKLNPHAALEKIKSRLIYKKHMEV